MCGVREKIARSRKELNWAGSGLIAGGTGVGAKNSAENEVTSQTFISLYVRCCVHYVFLRLRAPVGSGDVCHRKTKK